MRCIITIIVAYLFLSLFLIKDYGITWDEPENFGIGYKYVYYYQTGHLDFNDNLPDIPEKKLFYNWIVRTDSHIVWPFPNSLAVLSHQVFNKQLHVLDSLSSYHIIIPILTSLFLLLFFKYLRKYFGFFVAISSMLLFVTYPRLFGETFNNIKDIPELIFFSLTILYFSEWVFSKKLKYFYLSTLFFGLAAVTKMDVLYILPILIIWLVILRYRIRFSIHWIIVTLIIGIIIFICYLPLHPWRYANQKEFFEQGSLFIFRLVKYLYVIGINKKISWNLYAPKYLFLVTPPLILLCFIFGFIWLIKNHNKNKAYSLILIWFLFPVVRHCLPYVNHYDGIRHFLITLVPLSIISAFGIRYIGQMFSRHIRYIILVIIVSWNIYLLTNLHPFQTTYFNIFIKGLRGAQKINYPSSTDYWLNSYRKAGEWLNRNAKKNSYYYAQPYNDLFAYYVRRTDLKKLSVKQVLNQLPSNTYLIVIPRIWKESDIKTMAIAKKTMKIVYEIRRQGGEIISIYYKQ